MDCQQIQNRLSDYLDASLSPAEHREIQTHVKQCRACDKELRMLKLILDETAALEKLEAPDTIWQGIEAELDEKRSRLEGLSQRWRSFRHWIDGTLAIPSPVWRVAGAAAVLVIGILLGRTLLSPDRPEMRTGENRGEVQMVSARAANYIEKSQVLFLALVNAESDEIRNMDLSQEQRLAENLIREASFLKENLSQTQHARLHALVEELELILFEIANLEQQQDVEAVELIKSGIEQQSLLLKINLHELNEQPAQREAQTDVDVKI